MFLDHLISHENLESWIKKYDLLIFEKPCSKCGELLVTNIPIFGKDFRGLKSEDCSCGNNKVPFSIIFTNN